MIMKRNTLDDPDMPLDMVMSIWPDTVVVFLRHKMLCVGCMVNPFHTVIDACREYGLDEKMFRAELHFAAGA
jgi:hybrid cluster-associated redox disulfide protein